MASIRALLTASLLTLLVVIPAAARDIHFEAVYTASGAPSNVDPNGDGRTAYHYNGREKVTKGWVGPKDYTFETFVDNFVIATTTCPQGTLQFDGVIGNAVAHNQEGDDVISQLQTSTSCLDTATGNGTFSNSWTIIGGSGRYAGAKGSFNDEGRFSLLSCDLNGGCFLEDSGFLSGTLTLPR